MTKSVYLKQLLEIGLKKSQVTYIVGHADIFKGIPKQQGYPVNYTFNMCVFIFIGCGLMQLGLSFRHINEVLFELCDIDFEREFRAETDFYKNGLIKISFGDFLVINSNDYPYQVKTDTTKLKHNILDGKLISLTKKKRTSTLNIIKTKTPSIEPQGVFMEGNSLFITIQIQPILDKVGELFLEPEPF